MEHLVSVIIPVYKVEKYLNKCIDSVLEQTYKNMEIILVDDGSPDNCPQICDEYANKDNRIKVIHKENGGPSEARNMGIRIATGTYLIFLDSDDYWDGACFLEEVFGQQDDTSDLILFGFKKYYEKTNKFVNKKEIVIDKLYSKNELLEKLISVNYFKASVCGKIVKRDLILKNDMFFPMGLYSEDIEWCSRLILYAQSVNIYNKNVYVYRQRDNSRSGNVKEKYIIDILKMIEDGIETSLGMTDKKLKNIYLSYFAYEYTVMLGFNGEKNLINKDLKKRIYGKKHLLKYNLSKKVKIVYFVYKILGIKLTSRLLGIFIKIKNKKRRV